MRTNDFIKFMQNNKALEEILFLQAEDYIEPSEDVKPCDEILTEMNNLEKAAFTLTVIKERKIAELVKQAYKKYGVDNVEDLFEILEQSDDEENLLVMHKVKQLVIQKNFFSSLLWISVSDRADCAYSSYFSTCKDWKIVEKGEGACEMCLDRFACGKDIVSMN